MRIDSYNTIQQLLGQQAINLQGLLSAGRTEKQTVTDAVANAITGTVTETASGTYDYLSSAYSRVTISAFGRQISDLYQELKSIDDSAARASAGDGLTAVMRDLIDNPDALRTVTFMAEMGETRRDDPAAYTAFFEAADAVNDAGYSLTRWIDTYTRIEDDDAQGAYVEETGDILTAEEEDANLQREVFNRLLDNVNQIANSGLDGAALSERYDQYFGGLNAQSGLEDKKVFMARFETELRTPAINPSGTAA